MKRPTSGVWAYFLLCYLCRGQWSQRASVMDKKSEENILAAEELISKGYYNSSIHCSYYALFQHMKYILDHCGLCTYESQDKKTNTKGSHDNILKELEPHIKDVQLRCKVHHSFPFWKKLRSVADYQVTQVVQGDSQKCLDDVRDIIEQLSKCFNT